MANHDYGGIDRAGKASIIIVIIALFTLPYKMIKFIHKQHLKHELRKIDKKLEELSEHSFRNHHKIQQLEQRKVEIETKLGL